MDKAGQLCSLQPQTEQSDRGLEGKIRFLPVYKNPFGISKRYLTEQLTSEGREVVFHGVMNSHEVHYMGSIHQCLNAHENVEYLVGVLLTKRSWVEIDKEPLVTKEEVQGLPIGELVEKMVMIGRRYLEDNGLIVNSAEFRRYSQEHRYAKDISRRFGYADEKKIAEYRRTFIGSPYFAAIYSENGKRQHQNGRALCGNIRYFDDKSRVNHINLILTYFNDDKKNKRKLRAIIRRIR